MSLLLSLAGRLPTNWIRTFTNLRGRNPWVKRTTDWLPNRIRAREGVIQRGVIRGLRFNGGNSAAGFVMGTHDPNVQRALSLLIQPGSVVYDVGANVGFTALIAAHRTGPKGRVICFEPQPKCDAMIQHNADINGFSHIQVRREALGGEDGSARFMVTDNPTFSRLAGLGKPDATARHVDVSVRRLDALIAEESLPKPDVMKIDIEGNEGPMLEGAMATLRESKPVLLIELHDTNKVVAEALTKAGYTTRVLGSRGDILDAHWNALIIGVPADRPDLDAVLEQLTQNDADANG